LSNFELRQGSTSGICGALVTFLYGCDLQAQFLVKLIKVNGEFSGTSRGKISLGMNSNVRVVSFIGKEGRDTGGCIQGIVVSEFGEGKQ
jgi:hypothetical protein